MSFKKGKLWNHQLVGVPARLKSIWTFFLWAVSIFYWLWSVVPKVPRRWNQWNKFSKI